MIEVLKFAVEGPFNFIITLILSMLWGVLLITIIEKFRPINIIYTTQQYPLTKRKEEESTSE